MEQYRSGHNGHDWKSCVPQKGTEGSNPSCSAIKNALVLRQERFLMISVPVGTDDIADAMISALQMIYASRMKGTDIISYLLSKYIIRLSRISYRVSDISFFPLTSRTDHLTCPAFSYPICVIVYQNTHHFPCSIEDCSKIRRLIDLFGCKRYNNLRFPWKNACFFREGNNS